ncbi:MAG TPA: M50 family metallopeptidase, partial [Brevibacterium senegalense]|nr:M50 family metallopeptidase [Brevibacterium senegalense]
FEWAGGIRAIANLSGLHLKRRARDSDAAVLGRLTPLPAVLWIGVFWVLALTPAALVIAVALR